MQVAPFRKVWRHQQVVDVTGPAYTVRTYLEQADLRSWLHRVAGMTTIHMTADVGAGYGRLTPVLAEFAEQVVAFEREPHFITDIQRFLPHVEALQVQALTDLPIPGSMFQFVFTFTVLQHLDDNELFGAISELKRIVATPGFVLLCEATDPAIHYVEESSPEGGVTIGRSVEEYQQLLAPLKLIATAPRRVEPTFACLDTGTYMLFQRI
ncbi:MAG TPA: class I SAM-dependent methyltransferase [Herpetosiphonaceae bacterium]